MSTTATPDLISNNAVNNAINNNNNNASPADTIVLQNQQSPLQYRVPMAAATSTSLISDTFPPPMNVLPPTDNDTMTIPIQQQIAASKTAGWTTPTKNVGGNNAATNVSNNTGGSGGKMTPPRGPICILTPCSNSHPFEERRIHVTRTEENAVKIGRSVVRLQPSMNNAIFDCKVLSRNHAILWQTNESQFVIKDTRSSNGTFINNERLSASGEESEPKELFSGDILQLGVEIVDNAKKVASGCVTCIVRLVNDRGEEYASRPQGDPFSQLQIRNEQQIPVNYTLVRNDKIFVLEQYIKEAKFRENLLGQKLQTLEEQLLGAQESLQTKWEEHINQELLLSRIELLESQLGFFTNSKKASSSTSQQQIVDNGGGDTEERLKREMQQLMEDRAKAEQIAKETLRTKLEQMQETSMRLHDAEMSLVNVEEECAFLRQRCADYEDKQREEYDALLVKYNEICTQLSALEKANASAPPATTTAATSPKMNGASAAIDEQPIEVGRDATNLLNNKNKLESMEAIPIHATNSQNSEMKWIEVPATQMESTAFENASNNEQQPSQHQHECREAELKHSVAECQAELNRQRERYNLLVEKFNQKETQLELLQAANREHTGDGSRQNGNSSRTLAVGHSSTDFQVFMLSTLPFLLILMVIFSPIFNFFGLSSTTASIDNDETPDGDDENSMESEETKEDKEEAE